MENQKLSYDRLLEIAQNLLSSIDDHLYEFDDKLNIIKGADVTVAELSALGSHLAYYLEDSLEGDEDDNVDEDDYNDDELVDE